MPAVAEGNGKKRMRLLWIWTIPLPEGIDGQFGIECARVVQLACEGTLCVG